MMTDEDGIAFGRVVTIPDLLHLPPNEIEQKSFKITGRLKAYDPAKSRAVLSHQERDFPNGDLMNTDTEIELDTTYINNFPFQIDNLFQVIGEVFTKSNEKIMRIRVIRNMGGINLQLYNNVLTMLKEFYENDY